MNNNTALMLAVENGNLEEVKELIANGANANYVSKSKESVLTLTVRYGHLEIVKFLFEKGADVNYVGWNDQNTCITAATNNRIEMVRMLLGAGANVNNVGKTTAPCSTLVNKREETKKTWEQFFETKKIVEMEELYFYEKIMEISNNWANNEQLIINLLNNFQIKLQKIENLDSDIVNFLKKEFINNFKIDDEKYSLLHIAALYNMKELTKYLVGEWPTDIDLTDKSQNSAWDHACLLWRKEIAFAIKNANQATDENRKFVQDNLVGSSKERYAHIKKMILMKWIVKIDYVLYVIIRLVLNI
ncbi:ankyrin repeat domain-containing protein [Spiroplasma endosymbiont of Nebria brevicollis]|uniref:ankyrin repeat domain-containing protein n=1 Tax=Spiroplasma endosymbiont of Nebria brevicollis TaxID=3066284 RepID=UPI00313C960E